MARPKKIVFNDEPTVETAPTVEPKTEETTEYTVVESYTANINNKPLKASVGDKVHLTPTQYSTLKRFVL